MSSNYPENVTGREAAIVGVEYQIQSVICENNEEDAVVPSAEVKRGLQELVTALHEMQEATTAAAVMRLSDVEEDARHLLDRVETMENIGSWICDFEGEVEIRLGGGIATWTCPTCLVEQDANWEERTPEQELEELMDRQADEARGK